VQDALGEERNVRRKLASFVKSYDGLADGRVIREFGKRISACPPVRPEWLEKDTLLVGDAGGFCNPISGGGIGNALFSAKACADSIDAGSIKRFFDVTAEKRAALERIHSVYRVFFDDKQRIERIYARLKDSETLGSISNIIYQEYA